MTRKLKLAPPDVKTLPAIDGKLTEYRDELVPGLILRVLPTGVRTWCLEYKAGRHGRRYKLGRVDSMGLGEARDEARKVRARVTLGDDPQELRNEARRLTASRKGALTVGRLVERYLAESALRPSTLKEWRRLHKKELAGSGLGTMVAGELVRSQVRELGRTLAKRSHSAAIQLHELLRAAYRWAVDEELVPGSPFVGLRPPARRMKRARVLSPEELRAVLIALGRHEGHYAQATMLLLLTMVRRSMVVGMRADEIKAIDGPMPLWIVPPARAGMKQRERAELALPHLVPLTPAAAAIVKARIEKAGASGHLFPQARSPRRGETRKADTVWWSSRFVAGLRAAADEAFGGTLERWTIHDLRRTAATLMREELGVSREVVGLLLVHRAKADATAIYDRSELLGERRAALVAWSAYVARLASADQTPEDARVLPHRRKG